MAAALTIQLASGSAVAGPGRSGFGAAYRSGAEAGDVGWILLDHLYMYGARLTLHKKLNGKSRSSPDSPPTVPCLDFYFRHRSHTSASSEVTLYAWPPMGCVAAAVVSIAIGLLLRQKVGNCKDKGYLKMTPSPSKFGIIGIPDHVAGPHHVASILARSAGVMPY